MDGTVSLYIPYQRSSEDHLLLIQCYYRRKPKAAKLILFILNSSISSELFFLEIQQGSSLIDPVSLQEET
jgi:hypothetical protein